MSFSIDGIASGLDTTSIINQLMSVERMPITRLQTRQKAIDSRTKVWSDLDSKLSALRTLAKDLSAGGQLGAMTASSSSETIAKATAAPGASSGSFQFSVVSLASSHQLLSGGFAGATSLVGAGRVELATGLRGVGIDTVDASGAAAGTYALTVDEVSGGTATVTYDGVEQTVASTGPITLTDSQGGTVSFTASGTLTTGSASVAVIETDGTTTAAQLAKKIDDAGIGASASLLAVGGANPSRIFLSADGAGSANAIDVSSDLAAFSGGAIEELRAASDAVLDLGNGFQITRSSNRVEDLLPGVTIDLRKADPATTVTIGVTNDIDALVEDVKALVDAVNDVIKTTNKATASDPETRVKGALAGDSRAFSLTSSLRTSLGEAVTGGAFAVLGQVGIEVQRDGTYEFSEDEFRAALSSDTDGVRRLLAGDGAGQQGVFGALVDTVDTLTDTNGLIDAALESAGNEKRRIGDDIARYEERMTLVEARVRRQFSGLETMLQQMNAQMSQLAQSIANL